MAASNGGADEILAGIRAAAAEALGVSPDELPDDAGVDTINQWTSLQHLAVVAAVEERFGIEMTMDEMTTAQSLKALRSVVARYVNGG